MIDELIRQILLLPKEKKQIILQILSDEITLPSDERAITFEAIENKEQLLQRENDIATGVSCLITFDDHILNTNIYH